MKRNTPFDRPAARGAIRTVEEVAAALGLSRQRVQQIEEKALEKLRKSRVLKELI